MRLQAPTAAPPRGLRRTAPPSAAWRSSPSRCRCPLGGARGGVGGRGESAKRQGGRSAAAVWLLAVAKLGCPPPVAAGLCVCACAPADAPLCEPLEAACSLYCRRTVAVPRDPAPHPQAELRSEGLKKIGVHNLSPGMVTTELLMAGTNTPIAKCVHARASAPQPQPLACSLPALAVAPRPHRPLRRRIAWSGVRPQPRLRLMPAQPAAQAPQPPAPPLSHKLSAGSLSTAWRRSPRRWQSILCLAFARLAC